MTRTVGRLGRAMGALLGLAVLVARGAAYCLRGGRQGVPAAGNDDACSTHVTQAPGKPPVSDAPRQPTLYSQIVDAWSVRGVLPGSDVSGHDQFFCLVRSVWPHIVTASVPASSRDSSAPSRHLSGSSSRRSQANPGRAWALARLPPSFPDRAAPSPFPPFSHLAPRAGLACGGGPGFDTPAGGSFRGGTGGGRDRSSGYGRRWPRRGSRLRRCRGHGWFRRSCWFRRSR